MSYILGFIIKMVLASVVITFFGFGILWVLFSDIPLIFTIVALLLSFLIWNGFRDVEEER